MPTTIRLRALRRLEARIAYARGPGPAKLAQGIAQAVTEGNTYDRLHGLTRYGTPVAPLRSPRRGAYTGATGPPLAPHGMASRVIANFHARFQRFGSINWLVIGGWIGVRSKSGFPFLTAHNQGRGRVPARPIFGVSPRTWDLLIQPRIDAFRRDYRRQGR